MYVPSPPSQYRYSNNSAWGVTYRYFRGEKHEENIQPMVAAICRLYDEGEEERIQFWTTRSLLAAPHSGCKNASIPVEEYRYNRIECEPRSAKWGWSWMPSPPLPLGLAFRSPRLLWGALKTGKPFPLIPYSYEYNSLWRQELGFPVFNDPRI